VIDLDRAQLEAIVGHAVKEALRAASVATAAPRLMTIVQAAEHAGVHAQTIRAWVRAGAPCVRLGRAVRVDVAALLAWVTERQRRQAPSTPADAVLLHLDRARARKAGR
jgi:excisionase family DNA binding protein